MAEDKQYNFKRIIGMYKCNSATGPYIAGKVIGEEPVTFPVGTRLYLFRNLNKKAPNHPDYNLCIRNDENGKETQEDL